MSSESLANRIVRLLSANAHAMLDGLEGLNPEAMMNQFVRDLDEAIAEVATELGRDEAAKHLATASIARQNNEIEDTIAALHRSLDEATEKAVEHERTLLGLRAKRREMEAAVRAYLAAQAE